MSQTKLSLPQLWSFPSHHSTMSPFSCNKIKPTSPLTPFSLRHKPSPLGWHAIHHKPSAPFTSRPSEACSPTPTPSCLFLCNIQNTNRALRVGHDKPSAPTPEIHRDIHRDAPGPRLTSGAAEGGVPGQGDQPAQPEQQHRQEGDISEPHLRSPGCMSAPRGGWPGTEGGGRQVEEELETERQVDPGGKARRQTGKRTELFLSEQQQPD